MTEIINIMALRHSAFYSPLLYTMTGGFLKEQGLEANYQIANSPKEVFESLKNGSVHLSQLAVAASFSELEQEKSPEIVHFAQINQRDGFFIAGKSQKQPFKWQDLIGKKVLVDHLFQPLAMFRYALKKYGIDEKQIHIIDAGDVKAMEIAFKRGEADYIHQQGPAPQQLEYEGKAQVLASVGDVIGDVAFSSLCGTRAWLKTEQAQAFMRAYRAACRALLKTPAIEIAKSEAKLFPQIELEVLTETIATYQQLQCWSAETKISQQSYDTLLDVCLYNQMITKKYPYQAAIVQQFSFWKP